MTPPSQRHLFHSGSAFYMTPPARRPDTVASRRTSRTASPLPGGRFGSLVSVQSGPGGPSGHQAVLPPSSAVPPALHGSPLWRSSPRPHSSPKMKLRFDGVQNRGTFQSIVGWIALKSVLTKRSDLISYFTVFYFLLVTIY